MVPLKSLNPKLDGKQRQVNFKLSFTEEQITDILKKNLKPNKTVAIFAPHDIFQQIEKSYKKYKKNIYTILKYTILLTDLLKTKDQEFQINRYHKNNSSMIITDETLKYNRHPPNIKFQVTETPIMPLDILHSDLYTLNGKYVATATIDKFSTFSLEYTIPAINIVNALDES